MKLWCRLFHRKAWRILWWTDNNEGVREFWEGDFCRRCGLVNNTRRTGTINEATWSMSKVGDPTNWDYETGESNDP